MKEEKMADSRDPNGQTTVPSGAQAAGSDQTNAKMKAGAHWLAGVIVLGLIGAGHFVTSSAGQALIAQYPKLTALAGVVTSAAAAAGVYYSPK
jgi:hypothetical protein